MKYTFLSHFFLQIKLSPLILIQRATRQQSSTTVQKWNQKQVYPILINTSNIPRGNRVKFIFVARPLLRPAAHTEVWPIDLLKLCSVLNISVVSKLSAVVREVFGNAYPDK
jgi:hypothetical protein